MPTEPMQSIFKYQRNSIFYVLQPNRTFKKCCITTINRLGDYMSIDSHTQLPEQILRHFRDPKNGQVWYINLQDGKIHKTASGKLGVETDYYSAEMEQHLNSSIETPLGAFWAKLKGFADRKAGSVTVNIPEEKVVKDYVVALIARSNFMNQKFEKESITAELCSPQMNHDDLVSFILGKKEEIAAYIYQLQVAYLSNVTTQFLVVPKNGYYCIKSNSKDYIIIPVSPTFAFMLKPADAVDIDENGNRIRHFNISSTDDVYALNLQALRFEYVFNRGFVAGSRKDELEALITFLEEHKEELEKGRGIMDK